jgi:hypothetical protein
MRGSAGEDHPAAAEQRDVAPGAGDTDESWRWIRWRPADPEAPRRGGGYGVGTTYTLVNSEYSYTSAYRILFPNRVGLAECRQAARGSEVYGWLYSFIEGSFTDASQKQRLFRSAYVDCPFSGAPNFVQELVVEQQGLLVARFQVPARMYVGYQFDVDQDGVTEAIVEWHRGITPAIQEGPFGIVGVRGGVFSEWYHGKWGATDRCSTKGATISEIALGVRRAGVDSIEVLEEQWTTGCDPRDVEAEIGGWRLTESRTVTIAIPRGPHPG